MGKAIRIGLVVGAIAAIVVAVLVTVVLSKLDEIVAHVVETTGSRVAGTRVSLDSASVKLKAASAELRGLRIDNPPGFDSDAAFELGKILVDIDTSSLGGDEIVLTEVRVEQAHLTYEYRGATSNLQTILDHVESASAEPATGDGEEEEGPLLVIETFRMLGSRVTLLHDELEEPLELELDDVVLTDVGRVGAGESAADAAKQILRPILDRAVDAAKRRAREELESRVKEELDERKNEAVESLEDKLLGKD
jgi:hypothetical protein